MVACSAGCTPACPGDGVPCGDRCVLLDVDAEHCGACNNPCACDEQCFDGSCRSTASGAVSIGTACDPGAAPGSAENPCVRGVPPAPAEAVPLVCDPVARTCGVACASDADCRFAGLDGYVCDTRALEDFDAGSSSARMICVHRACF
jgi:hypothetical protein